MGTFSDSFDQLEGIIDVVRLGPKSDLDFRFLQPDGTYQNAAGITFTAAETFAAGYVAMKSPVCSGMAEYGGLFELPLAISGEPGSMVAGANLALQAALGATVDYPVDFNAPDGNVYTVIIRVTRLSNGGTPQLNRNTSGISLTGGHDYRIQLVATPDVLGNLPELRWNVRPNSMNGGGENFIIQSGIDTYPVDYINGGQSNASLADWNNQTGIFASGTGFVWNNVNNASNTAAFEFIGSVVSFRVNSQANVGCAVFLELLSGPSFDVCVCEKITEQDARLDALENAPPPGAPHYAQASLVGQNGNQANAQLTLNTLPVTKGTKLVLDANTIRVDEDSYSVEVFATASYDYETGDANAAAEQRVSPILEIFKNGALVFPSATGYQRHATGHNDSSNTAVYIDLDPQVGDNYSVHVTQGATQNDVMLITQGQFTAKAY